MDEKNGIWVESPAHIERKLSSKFLIFDQLLLDFCDVFQTPVAGCDFGQPITDWPKVLDPRRALRHLRFEGVDRCNFFHRQPDVVEAIDQAMLAVHAAHLRL